MDLIKVTLYGSNLPFIFAAECFESVRPGSPDGNASLQLRSGKSYFIVEKVEQVLELVGRGGSFVPVYHFNEDGLVVRR